MSQEKDKRRQRNDTPDWQMHSGTKMGSEMDFAYIMNMLGNLAAVEIVRKRSSNALEGQLK